jgi:hypothetical protein
MTLPIRRSRVLTGVCDARAKGLCAVSVDSDALGAGTFAAGRTTHAVADGAFADAVADLVFDLGSVHLQLGEGAA